MAIYQSAKNILERVKDEEVLEKIKRVDGDGSGLDADLVRGYDMLTRNYVSPIDLSSATSDYNLAVGEVAKIDFSNATSVTLHIATQSGTAYKMFLLPHNTFSDTGANTGAIELLPNNTLYSNAFNTVQVYSNGTLGSGFNTTGNSFSIGFAFSYMKIFLLNQTSNKLLTAYGFDYGVSGHNPMYKNFAVAWNDTTTAWTSLGTITFPQSSSGTILVRRLM